MFKKLYIICFFFCGISTAMAQAPLVQWQQLVQQNNVRTLQGLIETSDGGFVGLGGGNLTAAYQIFKITADSSLVFKKNIPHLAKYGYGGIVETADGGFMVAGTVPNEDVDGVFETSTFSMVKLDKDGNVLWQKYYRGASYGYSFLTSFTATKDGGFIMAGSSSENAGRDKSADAKGSTDFWVVKTDSDGNTEWDQTIGGSNEELYPRIIQTEEGGYMIAGWSSSDISGDKTETVRGGYFGYDFWVLKLNDKGVIEWQKTIGGSNDDNLYMLKQTADKGYIIGGYSQSPISSEKTEDTRGDSDFWVLKLTATGTIEWQKTLGGDHADVLMSGYQDTDGGYILAGSSESNLSGEKTSASQGGSDFWILKLSPAGTLLWQKSMGGTGYESLFVVTQTKDGGFIVGGTSTSPVSGDKTVPLSGYWLIKFKPCTSSSKTALTICPKTTYNFNGNLLSAAGVYNGKFTNQNGCDSLVELTLSLYNSPTPLVDVKMNVLSSTNTYKSYQWLLNDAAINAATANSYATQASGAYRLAVVTANNCMDTSVAYQPVFESNLFVPNTFSPNGDGKNDVLKVYGNQLSTARLLVFDQWGGKVFESANANTNGWDGQSSGKMQPVGVYMYVLEAKLIDGTLLKKKGSVMLVR